METKVYLAIGIAVFTANAIYSYNQESRISSIEDTIESIHNDVQDIKTVIVEQSATPVKYSKKEFDCMARNIYYEAGIEPHVGKVAVAQVTLNRVNSGYWGNNICKVVYAKDQFSWTRDKRRAWLQNKGSNWEESKQVATQVLSYGMRVKPLKKALFYHADYVKPNWRDNSKRIVKVGQHIFYSQAKGSTLSL
jgi:spore germination cell wall hydrolase CwlJ-like protein